MRNPYTKLLGEHQGPIIDIGDLRNFGGISIVGKISTKFVHPTFTQRCTEEVKDCLPDRCSKSPLRTANIIAFSVQKSMRLNRYVTVVFSEQKGVGMAVGLRAQHHCGRVKSHGKVGVKRQIVLHIKVCVKVSENLEWEIKQLLTPWEVVNKVRITTM